MAFYVPRMKGRCGRAVKLQEAAAFSQQRAAAAGITAQREAGMQPINDVYNVFCGEQSLTNCSGF